MMQVHSMRAAGAITLLAVLAAAGCNREAPTADAENNADVSIQRTTNGVAHIQANDYEALAYGVAYAHAEDNVCQTANHLVTIRGERSRYFGADGRALLGLRMLPNETSDIFIASHMDDAALADAQQEVSAEAQAIAKGYVAGYNRYLADHEGNLPEACNGSDWLQPMTDAEYLRLQELTMVQIGVALMADALVAAAPPQTTSQQLTPPDSQQAVAALQKFRLNEPGLGSNGWAFGADVTRNGRGVMLGNPHFPWSGVNRFWQMHLTIPGELDVMGASIGHTGVVQIGFNKDVAWTHTVSTGKRFTLHELQLQPGEPTRYLVDGEAEDMTPQTVTIRLQGENGESDSKQHTVWNSRYGPVVVVPRAGLGWSDTHAYALQDANTLNLRALDIWVGFNRAGSVADLEQTLAQLGVPWVNTIAADRHGDALYADVSVVPDVDAARLQRCAPSEHAAGLRQSAGLVILDGSRSDCNWGQDADSPVPGLLPIERMPVVVRRDWVQNSNDSFWLSNPAVDWPAMSPLIGPVNIPQSLRTRAGIYEIGARMSANDGLADDGKVGIDDIQNMLFMNRNHAAHLVMDDLMSLCEDAQAGSAADACSTLAGWDRRNNTESRGAHLFREWWRAARSAENVWRVPYDADQPATTPTGLRIDDDKVRGRLLELLATTVDAVRQAGFDIDARLGDLQYRETAAGHVGLHGGDEFEGVLNKVETRGEGALGPNGYEINFGTSYVQTVTFDERGPIAEAILTYGQSSREGSPYAFDQLEDFAKKRWHTLPFHAADIEHARVGEVRQLNIER